MHGTQLNSLPVLLNSHLHLHISQSYVNMLNKRNFERLVWSLCALVAFYQSVTIMWTFVKTPYLISSTAFYPQTFQLPAVSICAHTPLYDKNYYTMFDNSIPDYLIGKQILFNEHYNKSQVADLITKCVVLLPNLTAAKCSEVTKVKIYVNKQVICYTYFDQAFMREALEYNAKIVAGFMIFEFSLNSKNTIDEVVTLVVHGNIMRPVPFFSSAGSIDINVNGIIQYFTRLFHWLTTFLIVLETSSVSVLVDISIISHINPPDDVCYDYTRLRYRNLDDCISLCKFNLIVNRTHMWPGEIFGTVAAAEANQKLLMSMDHDSSNETVICYGHVCPLKDCTQLDFTTTVRNVVPVDKHGKDRSTLSINIGTPFIKQTIIEYQVNIVIAKTQICSQYVNLFRLGSNDI